MEGSAKHSRLDLNKDLSLTKMLTGCSGAVEMGRGALMGNTESSVVQD